MLCVQLALLLCLQNVSDQVRLWEAESHRVQPDAAVFYDGERVSIGAVSQLTINCSWRLLSASSC